MIKSAFGLYSSWIFVCLAIATMTPSASAIGAEDRVGECEISAFRELESLNIKMESIDDVHVITILANQEPGTVIEYQSWVDFRYCSGNIVVRMTPACRVKETYTRGDCRFDGVAHF